jgi:16S rRNA (uracil1498-N3)-methyltransferase
MKTHRFIGDFELKAGPLTINDQELVHQIRDVLHLLPGEKIDLCDGEQTEALSEIRSVAGDAISVEIISVKRNSKEPALHIALYCAILKSDHFELVAQKTVETGVYEIIPVLTESTVNEGIRYDRVQRIIKEAAEQSGRGIVPKLSKAIDFKAALHQAKQNHEAQLFFDGHGMAIEDVRAKFKKSVAVFIGPEGGWDTKEIELAKESGFTLVSIGALTLRAETAAIIATYLVTRL